MKTNEILLENIKGDKGCGMTIIYCTNGIEVDGSPWRNNAVYLWVLAKTRSTSRMELPITMFKQPESFPPYFQFFFFLFLFYQGS